MLGEDREGKELPGCAGESAGWGQLAAETSAGNHLALAVSFPGEVAYGHETSLVKAIKIMCV